MKTFNTNIDVVQTLTRAALKFGGGYLVARGLADENTVELITAAFMTLIGVLWSVWQRKSTDIGATLPKSVSLLLLTFTLALMFVGCASPNAVAFRTEKLATDSAYAALMAWKAYYATSVTNADESGVEKLREQNEQVYTASRQFAAAMSTADAIRHSAATNAAAGQDALTIALDVGKQHSSNVVWVVKYLMSGR